MHDTLQYKGIDNKRRWYNLLNQNRYIEMRSMQLFTGIIKMMVIDSSNKLILKRWDIPNNS